MKIDCNKCINFKRPEVKLTIKERWRRWRKGPLKKRCIGIKAVRSSAWDRFMRYSKDAVADCPAYKEEA